MPAGIDYVVGGMHLMHAYEEEEPQRQFCRMLAKKLLEKKGAVLYRTLHRA